MKENRKSVRIPFSESDAVYGILEKAGPETVSLTLAMSEISEEGMKFKPDKQLGEKFAVGDKLFLKSVIGTRNLSFDQPIELTVQWREVAGEKCLMGCEITAIDSGSKKRIDELIRAEKVFTGKWLDSENGSVGAPGKAEKITAGHRSNGLATNRGRARDRHDRMPHPRASVMGNLEDGDGIAAGAVRNKPIRHLKSAVIVGVIGCMLVFLFYRYSYQSIAALSSRLDRIEKKVEGIQAVVSSDASREDVGKRLQELEDITRNIDENYRKNDDNDKAMMERMAALDQKIGAIEAQIARAAAMKAQDLPARKDEADKTRLFHRVQPGENLFRISLKYNVLLEKLAADNGLKTSDAIYPGQKIKIPQ